MKEKEVDSEVEPASRGASLVFHFVHDSDDRVVRGGSWLNSARGARVAFLGRGDPAGRDDNLGFRLARDEGGT